MNLERPYTQRSFSLRQERHIPQEVLAMTADAFMRDYPIEELAQWECELTQDMEEVIDEMNDGYQRLVVPAGIEPFRVDMDRLHIIPSQIYKKYSAQIIGGDLAEQSQAMVRNGHMYIIDSLPFVRFLVRLFHEYMHIQSYTKQVMRVVQNTDPVKSGAFFDPRNELFRNGVLVSKDDGEHMQHYGTGLDEAITEFVALALRRVTTLPKELGSKARSFLTGKPTTYLGQIAILEELTKRYLHSQLIPGGEAFTDLLRLHVMGDPEFLQKIGAGLRAAGVPNGLKLVFAMTPDLESAKNVRTQLKF